MKHRFLVQLLSHTILVVDITSFGPPNQVIPEGGEEKKVPALRFRSWQHASQYFRDRGAESQTLESLLSSLKHSGVEVLTII